MLPLDELDPFDHLRLLETTEALILPNKTFLKLKITSDDVIHAWSVPAFGVKTDAVPGRINTVVLYIPCTGTYYGQCSELCGVNHGFMPIKVDVISLKDFSFDLFTTVLFFIDNKIDD
jgi:cytochrome c oxidase subunit 2